MQGRPTGPVTNSNMKKNRLKGPKIKLAWKLLERLIANCYLVVLTPVVMKWKAFSSQSWAWYVYNASLSNEDNPFEIDIVGTYFLPFDFNY